MSPSVYDHIGDDQPLATSVAICWEIQNLGVETVSVVFDVHMVIWEERRQIARELGRYRPLSHRILKKEAIPLEERRDSFPQPSFDLRLVHACSI